MFRIYHVDAIWRFYFAVGAIRANRAIRQRALLLLTLLAGPHFAVSSVLHDRVRRKIEERTLNCAE